MIKTKLLATALVACSLFTLWASPAHAARPPRLCRSVTQIEWRFRIIYTAPDTSKTKTAWSEWMPPPIDPPAVHPPRQGSVAVKVQTRPGAVCSWR